MEDTSENKVVEEGLSLGPPVEATDASISDDSKRNRLTATSRHGRPNTGLEIDTSVGDTDHHDTSDENTTRDALNIAIEFDENNVEGSPAESRVYAERYYIYACDRLEVAHYLSL